MLQTIIGHLLNPEVGGQPFSEVKRMRLSEAYAILDAINKSNEAIAKASKKAQK